MPEYTCTTQRTAIAGDRPFWRCAELFGHHELVFLLDSALDQGREKRFSYLGGRPAALLTGRRGPAGRLEMNLELWTWRTPAGVALDEPKRQSFVGDPFAALRQLNGQYPRGPIAPDTPPFTAGLVGYFGYETAHAIEQLPDTGTDDGAAPDLAFMVVDDVLVHDHDRKATTLFVTRRGPDAVAQAAAQTDRWQAELAALPATPPKTAAEGRTPSVRAQFDRQQYMAAVGRCRDHILRGDVFEVCLTQQLEMDLPGSAWDLYGVLRAINPAPYASYLQLPGCQIVSASPERFLQLDRTGVVESRPIKGTRPRGDTTEADARLRAELGTAEKDGAENIMIVDLVRSDLGRVCRIGSVEVSELRVVETYATVHQLVSTVRGRLKPEHDALDLVRACFPGGSMTGAPKIEAMKIIDSIEPVQRGIYSGAMGYIDASGAMDLGMVIRTIVCEAGVAKFGVGGAVVSDSDPAAEYEETLDKAQALITAVTRVPDGGGS